MAARTPRPGAFAAALPVLALSLLAGMPGCGRDPGRGGSPGGRNAIEDVIAVASGPTELVTSVVVGPERVAQLAPAWTDTSSTAADWRPDDAALDRLVTARRVVLLGLDFEPWAQRAGLPPSRVLELESLIAGERVVRVETVTHTHGKGAAHSHGGTVPAVWSDPALLQAMVHGAGEALTGVLESVGSPEQAIERRRRFEERLITYREALDDAATALGDRPLVAAGNGLEYVARAMDAELRVARLETQGGRPSDHGLEELQVISRSGEHPGVLVWLEPVDAELAATIEGELGLVSVQFDLGAEPGGPADTLDRLIASANALRDALRP